MSPVSKRSLPKKQKLTSSTGKTSSIPNLKYTVNCYSKNGLNEQKDKLDRLASLAFAKEKQSKEKEQTKTKGQKEISLEEKILNIKTELIEKNTIEGNVNPGSSGSNSTRLVPGLVPDFVSEFADKLQDHLNHSATKTSSLEADLKFTKNVLERAKNILKNERAEKEKTAKELSELRKTHNNLLEEKETIQRKLVEENTNLQQELTAVKEAYTKLKNRTINFICNFNPLDEDISSSTNSNASSAEPTVQMSRDTAPQDTDNGIKVSRKMQIT